MTMRAGRPSRRSWILALTLLAGLLPAVTEAADSTVSNADRDAIRSVIQRQIDAFRRDDAPAAFALASPGIQRRFHDADTFLAMVRSSYQAVYRPQRVTFLDASLSDGGQVLQRVLVVGPDGVQVLAVYPMTRLPNGSWVTDGCFLEELPSKQA